MLYDAIKQAGRFVLKFIDSNKNLYEKIKNRFDVQPHGEFSIDKFISKQASKQYNKMNCEFIAQNVF